MERVFSDIKKTFKSVRNHVPLSRQSLAHRRCLFGESREIILIQLNVKSFVYNRAFSVLERSFYRKILVLENVESIKYLGLTINNTNVCFLDSENGISQIFFISFNFWQNIFFAEYNA